MHAIQPTHRLTTRRAFLRKSLRLGSAAVFPFVVPAQGLGRGGGVAPSNRIALGGIGIGPRGKFVLAPMLAERDVRFVATYDVQARLRDGIKGIADGTYGNKDCATYRDLRELLARPDIDAVSIATGDRWHALGSIVGGSPEGNLRSDFLATKRRFRNFVLRLDYKLVAAKGCNSGVQFRSVRVAQPPNGMSGYQADIGAGHSGCLYDESRRKRFLARAPAELIERLEKPGDWNHYEIRCDGTRIELRLNGEPTVTYREEDPGIPSEGLIALQIHGNCKGEIAFRQISLEQLP